MDGLSDCKLTTWNLLLAEDILEIRWQIKYEQVRIEGNEPAIIQVIYAKKRREYCTNEAVPSLNGGPWACPIW